MSEFILAIDVGNTRTKLGLFADPLPGNSTLPACLYSFTTEQQNAPPWSEIALYVRNFPTSGLAAVIAGTRPEGVEHIVDDWPNDEWPLPTRIEDPSEFPLRVLLDAPEKVGIDRLLNAVAANVLRPSQTPALLIDCGSATTVDYLSADGAFCGGAILPGFELCGRSLHQYTALLPLIRVDDLLDGDSPPAALGRSTRDAMRSGLFWGQLGAVRELIARLQSDGNRLQDAATDQPSPQVLLTGGGAGLLQPYFPDARFEPHLALQGLALVANAY